MVLVEAEWALVGGRVERDVLLEVRNGRVVHVGLGERPEKRATADADLRDRLRGKVLLPGFVNCHSHAFQRALRGLGEVYEAGGAADSFWTWRQDMYALVDRTKSPEAFRAVTRKCFEEMRRTGITTVGEFHYFHHAANAPGEESPPFALDEQVVQAAKEAGVRLVLLNAFYAFGGFGEQPLGEAQRRFETASVEAYWTHMDKLAERVRDEPLVSLGVVAHSLRAVSAAQLGALHAGAATRELPFHLHIEEQPKEVEDCRATHGRTPMRVLLDTAKVDQRTTAVHCNHTEPAELREFVAAGGNVCICPLTEGNLGDGVMPDLGACVERVCLGTDCNARIDMLEEMRWLEYSQRLKRLERGVCAKAAAPAGGGRVASGTSLFKLALENGARSLGVDAGRIAEGALADFCVVDLASPVLTFRADEWADLSPDARAERLLATLAFGAGASDVVAGTCVGGDWAWTH